ncbi:MAG TPA: NAD(P)/FAD-dependent oxidoreductase [Candidatus Binatia bacterium]|nr:NAD(P)/FAD-dependent oxidoreductase [Candidatus Binatia bacterium]
MAVRRVVVLGAGFAGLRAVRRLARAGADVLWIDRHNYHLFLPLLYQVATAGLEPQSIAYPVRRIIHRRPHVDFRLAHVVGADPAARTLTTARGEAIAWDWLIVAAGAAAQDFGISGVREHALNLYDLEDARALRNHVVCALEQASVTDDPERRAALCTFVVVGGGPTGVETAGALAELRRHVVARDYRALGASAVRIVLLEAAADLLAPFPPGLRTRAVADLRALGVEVRLGTAVARVGPGEVELADGGCIATRTAIWAAGVRAAPVAARLGLPTGRNGRIRVAPTLEVPGHPCVFAAGDVALVDGAERLPQVAQVAIQQGEHAATNVLRALRGEPLVPFTYRDKGTMATIGRSRALAVIGRLRLAGRLAWWCWLAVHVVMLIGFRNRLVVLVDWAWNYLTYDRGARAIVGAVDGRGDAALGGGGDAADLSD